MDTLDWAAKLRESNVPPHQDYNHVNGNLTAVHESADASELTRNNPSIRNGPWENSDVKDWDTNFPDKILNTELHLNGLSIDLWNIRAIPGSMHGEEKIKILENTYNRIKKGNAGPCILAGDFNGPQRELSDGTLVPWRHEQTGTLAKRWQAAERNILTGLSEIGMVDVFRELNGYGDLDILDVSHATRTEDPLAVPPEEIDGVRFDHLIASKELMPAACWYDQNGFSCSDRAPDHRRIQLITRFTTEELRVPSSVSSFHLGIFELGRGYVGMTDWISDIVENAQQGCGHCDESCG